MCGIAGFLEAPSGENLALSARAVAMADTLRHRGPDDAGVWTDATAGIALAHRRLSIIDLSPEGHQPMVSACGRYVIAFNGEIYNFRDVRRELEGSGSRFRGGSDTEVIVEAVSAWGFSETLQKLAGMFAFAVWDRNERTLSLARDRMGEKPLYYGWANGVFLFGSELKALKAHPAWRGTVRRDSIALFLRRGFIPSPWSIYDGVFKLPPATSLTLRAGEKDARPRPYWSLAETVRAGAGRRSERAASEGEAVESLDALLRKIVGQEMVSDVPLGALLSGGIDSSAIVALMRTQGSVKTFTIGFREAAYDEAAFARRIASHLGTEHTEMTVTPEEALSVIPLLPSLYDEPFADASQVPTYLVAKMAREHVTVCLSGDGGDEAFGGYNRHVWSRRIREKTGWLPQGVKNLVADAIASVSPRTWDAAYEKISPLLPDSLKARTPGDKIRKLAHGLAASTGEELYAELTALWRENIVLGAGLSGAPAETAPFDGGLDLAEEMMARDAATYLPDDVLVKVDRATMGVSLESRAPFLDHRLVEFAWTLPLDFKIREGRGKWILRKLLEKYVPAELFERPKMGFALPIDSWLRGSLRDWAESLLNESRLKQEGYLDPAPVARAWAEHLSVRHNRQDLLWSVLMFQSWLEHQ